LTSIVFSDVTGQPWYIQNVALNRELFSDGRAGAAAGQSPTEYTNVLTVEPLSLTAYSNVAVKLKGLPTPVILVLATAQQEIDMRLDVKVPGRNPDALDGIQLTSMPNIDATLTAFLDGVPPPAAKRLVVTGLPETEGWTFENSTYLKVDADVQYPAYWAAAKSTSGKAVYRFASRPASVTVLRDGKAVTLFLEPRE
jgi:intracellular multiplication protein IcmK